ncbi:MAG: hypothetical protein IJ366_00955, partial [Clostridia bacterium]|nr:hypothetical protein [Clostridia bacterium]
VTVFFLIINILAPCAFADSDFLLYNCGSEVGLNYELLEYNGSKYIFVGDLPAINLEYEDNTVTGCDRWLYIYPDSDIVEIDGLSLVYKNAAKEAGGLEYISLDLISMVFSKWTETTDTSISLYITDDEYSFARGRVSLPDGKTAPSSGVELTVFAGYSIGRSVGGGTSSTNSSFSAGYSGISRPVYTNTAPIPDYEMITSKIVVIPEGGNSIEFFLYSDKDVFDGYYIGYTVNSCGYQDSDTTRFRTDINLYEFEINIKVCSISGTVTLPSVAEEAVGFTIAAEGKETYVTTGTIEKGAVSADYSLLAATGDAYTMHIVFDDGKYMRYTRSDMITVEESNISDIDFTAENARMLTVELILPENYTAAEDITAKVVLQKADGKPYYYLDTEAVTIPSGESSAEVTLYDDIGCDEVICYYELLDSYDGLYDFGHYSSDGTASDVSRAAVLSPSIEEVSVPLLEENIITVTVALPDGETAEANIYGKVTAEQRKVVIIGTVDNSDYIYVDEEYDISDTKVYNNIETPNTSFGDKVIEYDIATQAGRITTVDIVTDKGSSVISAPISKKIQSTDDTLNASEYVSIPSNYEYVLLSSGADGGASSGGGGSSGGITVSAKPIITAGEASGSVEVSVPVEDGIQFLISFTPDGNDERYYYGKTYYCEDGSTVLRSNADTVQNSAVSITLPLMHRNTVSGTVTSEVDRLYTVNALYNEGSYMRIIATGEVNDDGSYSLALPEELDEYTFALERDDLKYTLYYAADGTAESSAEADCVAVTSDTDGIDFYDAGYNPSLPIEPSFVDVGMGQLSVKSTNTSDFTQSDLTVWLCTYDSSGRLLECMSDYIDSIEPDDYGKAFFDITDEEIEAAASITAYVWNNGLRPMSYSVDYK